MKSNKPDRQGKQGTSAPKPSRKTKAEPTPASNGQAPDRDGHVAAAVASPGAAEIPEDKPLLRKTVEGDQTEKGSWASWPDTRPPIFGNSDESMTALATLAVLPAAANGDDEAKGVRDRAVKWLAGTKTDGDPQSLAMRLVLWTRLGRPAEEWGPLLRRIRGRQNADGGWSQAGGMASDAWATGQALYALAESGLGPDDPAVRWGQAFLVKTQRADGSWAMTSRPCPPSGKGCTSLIPITGAGTAWGTLGLVRSSPIMPMTGGPAPRP
jgi:hypothetical protein